jgi:transcriptional regulator with XRE-family HTH domain
MSIGTNIKILRAKQKISQRELALKVGITHNYLSMIENDAKKPSLTLLEKLSEVLSIPLATLFTELSLSSGN